MIEALLAAHCWYEIIIYDKKTRKPVYHWPYTVQGKEYWDEYTDEILAFIRENPHPRLRSVLIGIKQVEPCNVT